jgi:hypothetical protein
MFGIAFVHPILENDINGDRARLLCAYAFNKVSDFASGPGPWPNSVEAIPVDIDHNNLGSFR